MRVHKDSPLYPLLLSVTLAVSTGLGWVLSLLTEGDLFLHLGNFDGLSGEQLPCNESVLPVLYFGGAISMDH